MADESTPKRVAIETLFNMLQAESKLAYKGEGEISRDLDDMPDHKARRTHDAYQRQLRRAAKPLAEWLISKGDDLATSFPYDDV